MKKEIVAEFKSSARKMMFSPALMVLLVFLSIWLWMVHTLPGFILKVPITALVLSLSVIFYILMSMAHKIIFKENVFKYYLDELTEENYFLTQLMLRDKTTAEKIEKANALDISPYQDINNLYVMVISHVIHLQLQIEENYSVRTARKLYSIIIREHNDLGGHIGARVYLLKDRKFFNKTQSEQLENLSELLKDFKAERADLVFSANTNKTVLLDRVQGEIKRREKMIINNEAKIAIVKNHLSIL